MRTIVGLAELALAAVAVPIGLLVTRSVRGRLACASAAVLASSTMFAADRVALRAGWWRFPMFEDARPDALWYASLALLLAGVLMAARPLLVTVDTLGLVLVTGAVTLLAVVRAEVAGAISSSLFELGGGVRPVLALAAETVVVCVLVLVVLRTTVRTRLG